ncbi:MAG: substrate-binding domain-containing protein [Lacisediminihabitans sp.]
MKTITARTIGIAASLLLAGGVMTACSATPSSTNDGGSSSSDVSHAKIGLLLPEVTTLRYEEKDRPYFTDKLKELCPNCDLLYANASSDASKQLQQAQSMLTQGVKVLVVDPYDGVAAASIVAAAKAQNVPVVTYDRAIKSPDVSFAITNDYEKVGELQATALVNRLKELNVAPGDGGILKIDGAETDANAANIKLGSNKIIDASGYKVLAQVATWDPAEAQTWVAGQLTKFGAAGAIVGVYSANDGNGGAAIASMKAAGIKTMPPVTGLDASLAGLQAVVAGDQYMTVYNPFKTEADQAAQTAWDLVNGKKPTATATINGIPTFLNQPVAVTVKNIMDTIIKDQFYKVSDICTANYAAACDAAGIK